MCLDDQEGFENQQSSQLIMPQRARFDKYESVDGYEFNEDLTSMWTRCNPQ